MSTFPLSAADQRIAAREDEYLRHAAAELLTDAMKRAMEPAPEPYGWWRAYR